MGGNVVVEAFCPGCRVGLYIEAGDESSCPVCSAPILTPPEISTDDPPRNEDVAPAFTL